MRTITTTVYNFDELTMNAKRNAIERLRDINVDHPDWHENVLYLARQDLAAAGFDGAEILYSGFWCQGDGASFTARVDIGAWITAKGLAEKYGQLYEESDQARVRITREGHYYHEYTMDVAAEFGEGSVEADRQLSDLKDAILEDARERARNIYRRLEGEYEFQTSDEQVAEAIRACEYEFTEDGEPA